MEPVYLLARHDDAVYRFGKSPQALHPGDPGLGSISFHYCDVATTAIELLRSLMSDQGNPVSSPP